MIGERGHLGHLYSPSINVLSDFKAPSHTGYGLTISKHLEVSPSQFSRPCVQPTWAGTGHSFCHPARSSTVSPPTLLSTHRLGLCVLSNFSSCVCDQRPVKKQLQKHFLWLVRGDIEGMVVDDSMAEGLCDTVTACSYLSQPRNTR